MTTKKTDGADGTQTNDAPVTTTAVSAAKPHYATQDFTDAGTERHFAKDAELTDVEPGAIINYAAAGLATTEKPAA